MAALASLPLSAVLPATQQTPDAAEQNRRFAALPAQRQLEVLAAIETRLRADADPSMLRVGRAAQEARDPPKLRPRTFHDPKVFAPVAPPRTVVEPGAPQWATVRSDFPAVRPLRDFTPTIVYDWANGGPARALQAPTPTQRFANFVAGYHPDADAAIAATLLQLDRDADQHVLAHWCEQLYADRDGRVFAGITLYEAWYSRRTVEVPDVDAIAFARTVLITESFVSPIPDGARRDRLYHEIHEAFARHRTYRTLCEAAAAAFVTASPALDPTYLALVDRMHLLWAECDYDVQRLAARLTAQDRSELLEQLDRRLTEDGDAARLAMAGKDELRALAERIRANAATALDEATRK